MLYLHVVLLHDDKLLLHATMNTSENEQVILLECKIMSEYARKHHPIRILESVVLYQNSEIDFFVKKYMKAYGINNVRGGSYSSCELSKDEIHFIKREHEINLEKIHNSHGLYTSMLNEYQDIHKWPLDKINQEMTIVNLKRTQYEKEVKMLQNLSVRNDIATTRVFLADLKWLINQCSKYMNIPNHNCHPELTRHEIRAKYKQIVEKMKAIHKITQEHVELDVKYEPQIHLYAPETAFDIFILHNNYDITWEDHVKIIIRLIEYNEYMFYCVINRLDEYAFDVSTYPPNFKEITQYKTNYLQSCIDSRFNDSRGIMQDISCLS